MLVSGGTSGPGWPGRLGEALILASAVCLPPLLIIPIQIHTSNPYEFSAGLTDLLPGLAAAAIVAAALLCGVLLGAAARHRRVFVSLAGGVALAVWAQGQLLVWDYGVLDGREIAWAGFPGRILADTLLWLGVLGLALAGRRWLAPRAWLIGLALLGVQGVPAAWSWLSAPRLPDFHRYNLEQSHKFRFSSNENVVVLILDAFQSDVFHRIINDDPTWREELDGFTYFRNSLAGYSKTYPSVALMMTGQWYDNGEPIQAFIERAFKRESLPRDLLRAGWRVDLFPHLKRVVHPIPRVATNAVPVISCADLSTDRGRLLDLGMFRISPHWLKTYWMNNYRWRFTRYLPKFCESAAQSGNETRAVTRRHSHAALGFVEGLGEGASADLEEVAAFKLYHLLIPHAPFHLDEDLDPGRLPGGREGFERQSRAALEVVRRFLDRLRELGIYERTLVAIVSDHGGGEYSGRVDHEALGAVAGARDSDHDEVPPGHLASGLPLILIKPPGSAGELAISDAPASLGDLARTIAESIGMGARYRGENLFALDADTKRERIYHYYSFSGWRGEFLPEMIEYRVDGFSWFPENWRRTGRVLSPGVPPSKARKEPVELGRIIRFRPGSPQADYLTGGWSEPEATGWAWSASRGAEIELPFKEAIAGALRLRIDYLPYTARGAIEHPRVEVTVNGQLHHAWRGRGRGWRELYLPAELVRDADGLHLSLHFPDAISPFEHGLGSDARTLGIALYGLELEYVLSEPDDAH